MNDRLVWIDCEMTGLDIERDALVEIACLVTDADLNLLDEGIDLVIKPSAEALESMPDVVREMHTASGLLAELPGGIAVAEAQELVLGYVRGHVTEARKVPLCGNSIATDRWFIARDMPELDAYLHYRMIDGRVRHQGTGAALVPADILLLPRQARRAPGPGRHQGKRAGTPVLPGGAVRPAAGTGFRDRAGDRRAVLRARGTGHPGHVTRGGPRTAILSLAARCPSGQRAFCCRPGCVYREVPGYAAWPGGDGGRSSVG